MAGLTVAGRRRQELGAGWVLARSEPGRFQSPGETDPLQWSPAAVPGTVAGALGEEVTGHDLDAHDWWFRVAFDAEPAAAEEQVMLVLGGLATVCEVWLNDVPVLASRSMYASHELDVGGLLRSAGNDLAICCRALTPLLAVRRKPRARWRTRLVSSANLRFYRTMLLGRAPGFSPGPAVVGPWRPVSLERRTGLLMERIRVRADLVAGDGTTSLSAAVRALPGVTVPASLELAVAGRSVKLPVASDGSARGSVTAPAPSPWWPHTHGTPALHELFVAADGDVLHRSRVGFRALEAAADLLADGPALTLNGTPVFCRGAVWTPPSLQTPTVDAESLRSALTTVVGAGMNMLRVPGIATYEDDTFYDLCDELGVLVWQDFMFANLDYPESDPEFIAIVEREARALLERLGPRPSLAVVCGGSEVAQQVAMLGLDPALASGPLYGELLPRVVQEAEIDAPYIQSAPWGGELPFRTDRGVANYYGVGAYLRPLEDARRAEVRFAAECLAFANVPDEEALAALHAPGGLTVHHPAWKAGVPRDAGAGWDFEDVRDHYLRLLFEVDPVALRSSDLERYLELSRTVSGEVMAETFGEWRRAASPCTGALVLWLRDLMPGAGWGLLDHRGRPKVAYHHLRRTLAPIAVWGTDEGLGGIVAHVANDRGQPLVARLRVALYRDFATLADQTEIAVRCEPHGQMEYNVESLIGRFVDVSWAYRFGPPAQDLVGLTLSGEDGVVISQSFRFPAGRPVRRLSLADLGLAGTVSDGANDRWRLTVSSVRFAYGVRVLIPGWEPSDDAFGIEPGGERVLELRPVASGAAALEQGPPPGAMTALNLAGTARLS